MNDLRLCSLEVLRVPVIQLYSEIQVISQPKWAISLSFSLSLCLSLLSALTRVEKFNIPSAAVSKRGDGVCVCVCVRARVCAHVHPSREETSGVSMVRTTIETMN